MNSSKTTIAVNQVLTHIDKAYAPNTIRAFRSDFSEFIDFCSNSGAEALPASPQDISVFILHLADTGNRSSTIRRKVASISALHRYSYLEDPTKHPEVKIAIRKINRQLGTRSQQAQPISRDLLAKMLSLCGNDLRGVRNRLLLLLAYTTLRRRSELVSLRIEDIEFRDDGKALLLLRQSKTDQTRTGATILVHQSTTDAIKTWMNRAQLESGFLLRGLSGARLHDSLDAGQINRIFKRLAAQVGINSQQISGHSTRVGAAQDLLMAGHSIGQIMSIVGWSKVDTVMRYVGTNTISAINSVGSDLLDRSSSVPEPFANSS